MSGMNVRRMSEHMAEALVCDEFAIAVEVA